MRDHSTTPLEFLRLADLGPRDLIAPNFRFLELTRSEIATRLGIDNALPGDAEMRAAVHLARKVLQPVRDAFGPFAPASVYRSQATERALKHKPSRWISRSQHVQGCACDIEIPGLATLELGQWARDHLSDYDQIICECFDPRLGPNSGWVHISLKSPGQGENRREQLSYVRDLDSARWVYVPGLQSVLA